MRGTQYIPARVLESVGRVFDFGARKHAPLGWLVVPGYRLTFGLKMLRHGSAYFSGDMIDPDTGESHLAHLIADAMMILDRDMRAIEKQQDVTKEAPSE